MIVCECQDCCKEFEVQQLTEEEKEKICCPYCGSGDILIGDEE